MSNLLAFLLIFISFIVGFWIGVHWLKEKDWMRNQSINKERKGRQESNLVLDNNLSPRNKTFQKEVLSSLSTYFVQNYAFIQATFSIIRHSSPNNAVVVLGIYIMMF